MNRLSRAVLTYLTLWLSLLLLAGCVTSIDDALPYTRLPEIALASPVQLVASPSHPTAYLSSDPIPAGRKVQVIGADENMAWLLVLDGEMLGWMPAFFSATNIGALTPAVTFEPLDGECTQYLGATFDADEAWTSASRGDLYILGSIYRPQAGTRFSNAALSIQVSGGGAAVDSDYLHTPLTRNSAVIFFAYSVRDAQRNSRIGFNVSGLGGEEVLIQSLFFRNTCVGAVDRLSIGVAKSTVQQKMAKEASQPVASGKPVAPPTPIIRESGPPSSHDFDIALTICRNNCDIFLKIDGEEDMVQLTQDSGFDSRLSWNSDGSRFVFQSDRSGAEELYIYDMKRRRITQQITASTSPKAFSDWSPVSDEIVYQEELDDSWHIWKVKLDTMEHVRLTFTGTNKAPRFSPDGKKIAFSAARVDTNGDRVINDNDARHIWVMDSDGKNVQSIADDPRYYDWFPYWMPDGGHIVFSRRVKGETFDQNGPGEIYMADLKTGAVEPLTFSSANENVAIPSPNGQQFLIGIDEDGTDVIYLANWDGEALSELTRIAESSYSIWRPRPKGE